MKLHLSAWYEAARSRTVWRTLCNVGVEEEALTALDHLLINMHLLCDICKNVGHSAVKVIRRYTNEWGKKETSQ